jgi:two-component system, sporulation sensor kinase E
MPTLEFLEKIVKRLDRVDRKSLEQCVQTLAGEKELLVKLLDQVPAGLMMFALDRSLIYLNRRMMHLLNVSDKLLRQAKLEDVLSDRTLAQWVLTALKSQTEHFNETLDVLLPRPMQLDLTLCFEQNGNQTVGVLYATSLTEKERTARQKFQNQNLESLVSLASGVAHEIGNPINSLTIHLQLLAKAIAKIPARDQKNAAESIQAMKDEMARLDTIVRNFLRAARRKPLRFEKVQINQLIEKTLVLLKPELSQAKVKVSTIVDQKLPEFSSQCDLRDAKGR